MNAQVPYVKWHRSMHTVNPQVNNLNHISKTLQVFNKKNPHIHRPMQFKLMLFKSQLHTMEYYKALNKEIW